MKNRKVIIIVLAIVMVSGSVGISTGFIGKVLTACKAFIYCNGAPLETKKLDR